MIEKDENLKPEPPKIIQNMVWLWVNRHKYWVWFLLAALVVIVSFLFNEFEWGSIWNFIFGDSDTIEDILE